MNSRFLALAIFCGALSCPVVHAADAAANKSPAEAAKAAGLTSAQFLSGAKSGLSALVEAAAAEMTKPGGMQISTPGSMSKLEGALKRLNQSGAFDAFKASLNQVATSVAPQTTAVIKSAIEPLTLADATALYGNAPDSATKLLRKTTEANLRTKLMPLVAQALAQNGSAAKAKELLTKAGPMASMMGVPNAAELESHVLNQVLETTFGYLAKQEAALRANPATLKDAAAQKVFSAPKS